MTLIRAVAVVLLALGSLLAFAPGLARAQDPDPPVEDAPFDTSPDTAPSKTPPAVRDFAIGEVADWALPEGFSLIGPEAAKALGETLEADCVGVILSDDRTWAAYVYHAPDEAIDVGNGQVRAWDIMKIIHNTVKHQSPGKQPAVRWHAEPKYVAKRDEFTWSLRIPQAGAVPANAYMYAPRKPIAHVHNTVILTRRGYLQMAVTTTAEDARFGRRTLKSVMSGLTIRPGQRFSDRTDDDPEPEHGLSYIITGEVTSVSSWNWRQSFGSAWKTGLLVGLAVLVGGIIRKVRSKS